MTRRQRTLRYGASIAVAVIGVACGALIPGSAGGTAATVLVGIGLVGVVSLIFYEVGLTEDRDRAREQRRGDGGAGSPRATGASGAPGATGDTGATGATGARGADGERPSGEHRVAEDQPGEHQGGRLRPMDRRRGQRRRLR